MKTIISAVKFTLASLLALTVIACGGSGGGDPAPNNGNDNTSNPEPADRFVYAGDSNGNISILKVDKIAGFANPIAFISLNGFALRDMHYDQANKRLLALDASNINSLAVDEDTGNLSLLDSRPLTVSNGGSHIIANSAKDNIYAAVGSGATVNVDRFIINDNGTISPAIETPLSIDPDYIQLNPAEDKLYVVSRSDNAIHVFDINADGSLPVSPSVMISTSSSPTALKFNTSGNIAYLLRADNTGDSIEVFDVNANGSFSTRKDFENVGSTAIDLVISDNDEHLYVIETSSSGNVYHLTIDQATGELTQVNSYSLNLAASDVALSYTGEELYVSHSSDDGVSTLLVNSDGSLTETDWAYVYESATSLATVGNDNGALLPTPKYLLAPDTSGLNIYSVSNEGSLSLLDKKNQSGALIDGEAAYEALNDLVISTGEDSTNADLITSYTLDQSNDNLSQASSIDATIDSESVFVRLELSKSGKYIYALDQDQLSSSPLQRGWIRSYDYNENGNITSTSFDSDLVGPTPENLTMHPTGKYMYVVNSFGTASDGDSVQRIDINSANGSLTASSSIYYPGGRGSGVGRPIDLRFHPNGRYAYISVEDDNKMVRYAVSPSGVLSNISNTSGNSLTAPHGLAVHPNGRYLYVTEKGGANSLVVYEINQNDYSLSFDSRVNLGSVSGDWIEIDPQGRFLYVRYTNEEIELFNINSSTGRLTSTGEVIDAGSNGGFQATLTLISPLE